MSGDMTRSEIANLERLIRKQEKVLKATTEQRAAELRADFEAQMLARSLVDSTQVAQIHAAMLMSANENDDRLPTPGLIGNAVGRSRP